MAPALQRGHAMDGQLHTRTLLERLRRGGDERILVFAAHPGDETFAASALIQHAVTAGAKLKVVFVTDGACRSPRGVTRRRTEVRNRRSQAIAALHDLGVAAECTAFHALPVEGLTQDLLSGHSQLLEFVETDFSRFKPTLVVAPSRLDLHPDHNAVGLAVAIACARREDKVPTCLGYILQGEEPSVLVEDFLRVPVDGPNAGRKRQVIHRRGLRHCIDRRRVATLGEESERFHAMSGAALDGLTSEFTQGGLRVRSASRRLRAAHELQVLPTDHYLRPVSVRLQGSHMQAAMGSRASDELNIERTAAGLEFGFSAAHGPIWIKAASRRALLDQHGWLPVKTLPRPATRKKAVCCIIRCQDNPDSCGPLIESVYKMVDAVIAVDDGSSDDRLEVLKRMSDTHKMLRVIVQPSRAGKEAGLLAAFRYALAALDSNVLVTLDAEATRGAEDIARLVEAVQGGGVEIAIGARAGSNRPPWPDRLVNELARKLLFLAYRRAPRDVLSRVRAYNGALVKRVLECLEDGGDAVEFKILALALSRGRVAEIPVQTSHPSHPRDSLLRLLWRPVRAIAECARIATADRPKPGSAHQKLSGRGWL